MADKKLNNNSDKSSEEPEKKQSLEDVLAPDLEKYMNMFPSKKVESSIGYDDYAASKAYANTTKLKSVSKGDVVNFLREFAQNFVKYADGFKEKDELIESLDDDHFYLKKEGKPLDDEQNFTRLASFFRLFLGVDLSRFKESIEAFDDAGELYHSFNQYVIQPISQGSRFNANANSVFEDMRYKHNLYDGVSIARALPKINPNISLGPDFGRHFVSLEQAIGNIQKIGSYDPNAMYTDMGLKYNSDNKK